MNVPWRLCYYMAVDELENSQGGTRGTQTGVGKSSDYSLTNFNQLHSASALCQLDLTVRLENQL